MKVAVVVCSLLALASGVAILPATTMVRAPQFDSAVIKSDRLGGNFAYSTHEAHAYAAINPVVENIVSPVGVSYHATPIQYPAGPAIIPAYHQSAYAPAMFASPIAPAYPAYAPAMPVAAPVYPAYAPTMPVAAPVYPAFTAPSAPVADSATPVLADTVESAASSDDSVSVEAA